MLIWKKNNNNKKILIEHEADLIKKNWKDEIPIISAFKYGNKATSKYLIEIFGININKENERGEHHYFMYVIGEIKQM